MYNLNLVQEVVQLCKLREINSYSHFEPSLSKDNNYSHCKHSTSNVIITVIVNLEKVKAIVIVN